MTSKGIEFRYFKTKGFSFEIVKKDVGGEFEREFTDDALGYSLSRKELYSDWKQYGDAFFEFFAKKDNQNVYSRSLRVGTLQGNIEKEDIDNMFVPSIIEKDYCLSFGLYDSDAAIVSGLPNQHQVWACLTQNQSNWQTRLLKDESLKTKTIKLKNMVLPGSHDAGMYLTRAYEPKISNFANTQKDDTKHQLILGARFFDFRPGKLRREFAEVLVNKIPDEMFGIPLDLIQKIGKSSLQLMFNQYVGELRHIHAFIPGATFEEFIQQIVDFLVENSQEFVVVKISNSGFLAGCVDELSNRELLEKVKSVIGLRKLKVGDKETLNKSVCSLGEERLVILFQNDMQIESSYSDSDYEHYEANYIITALTRTMEKAVNSKGSKDLIDLQVQLTPTNSKGAKWRGGLGANIATSPLLATKSRTDMESYPWLLDNLKGLDNTYPLICIINDFYDNGLTEIAYLINKERLSKL
jgi:hypothetical protein